MFNRIRHTLIGVLGVVVIGCVVKLMLIGYGYLQAAQISAQAQQKFLKPVALATVDTISTTAPMETKSTSVYQPIQPPQVDFDALKNTNPDAIAWLWIADSNISYPVLRGEDNQRYLSTAYNGTHSVAGSIFMDYRNEVDFSDRNTIIYGHNMKDHSMFGDLKKYRDQAYAEKHQTVYLLTATETRRYRVFAVYDVTVSDSCYTRNFDSESALKAALSTAIKRSTFMSNSLPDTTHNFITLSTCTSGEQNRLVLQAYAIEE